MNEPHSESDTKTREGEAAAGGQRDGAAGQDMGSLGPESARPSSLSEQKRDVEGGGSGGSLGTGTFNHQGSLVGPDSPAGEQADLDAQAAEGQGDGLANRLGGTEGRGTGMSGGGSGTGHGDAARSGASGGAVSAPSAGEPGGMGGAGAFGGTAAGRPAGGVSPVANDKDEGK